MKSKTTVKKCGTCQYWTGEREPVFDSNDIPKVDIFDNEEKIYDSYNEEYASAYNLRNITFSVDIAKTIDLDITDVNITVHFDLNNNAEEFDKWKVCREVEDNIPEIDFSQYGSTEKYISYYVRLCTILQLI